MKRMEKILDDRRVIAVKFHDSLKELIDIDTIFIQTNKNFVYLLNSLGISTNFDFSNRDIKKLYTHEFIKTMCEFIKNHDGYSIYFYSDIITKDKFRNQLIRKLKTIFGFKVLEDIRSMDQFICNYEEKDAEIVTKLELFLTDERRVKSFKHIKKYLVKNGLVNLSDAYFENISNKLILFN